MTDAQWELLLRVVGGERVEPGPVGLIVDSPWLAGWYGVSLLDYFTDDEAWLGANFRAVERFPNVLFLPGFWAEYAMCTEPSAFGCKCVFPENDFPNPERIIQQPSDVRRIKKPHCQRDGLLPFVLKRLERAARRMEAQGHRVRFATSRGPMNIASYLMGQTDFLVALKTDPEPTHHLLQLITEFIVEWLGCQHRRFPSIEGILVLDDLLGFVGEADFREFGLPYLKAIFESLDVPVKALHNDAHGLITARYLQQIGVNLFNFSFEHGMETMRRLAGESVTLLGNIPPRDVLASGTSDEVRRRTAEAMASTADHRRIIWSAGGGAPPGMPSENLDALCAAVAGFGR